MNVKAIVNIFMSIQGPILCKATAPTSCGVDATFDRDHEDKPYIDGSHLKGKLREALREIGTSNTQITEWFGTEGELENGIIFFNPLYCATQPKEGAVLHRIKMDVNRGVVAPNALLKMENPFPPGANYDWLGTITFFAPNEEEAKQIMDELTLGLKWITGIGSEKSIGFGKIAALRSDLKVMQFKLPKDINPVATTNDVFPLSITARDPLLIGDVKMKANYLESRDFITGSAVKAALAQAVNTALCIPRAAGTPLDDGNATAKRIFPLLCKYLEHIRFTHAFPSTDATKRPVIIPLSAVFDGEKHHDVALCKGPKLINGVAPKFQTDWKENEFPDGFGWATPKRFTKTRTAIDWHTRRADDGQMFTYTYVSPKDEEGSIITWLTNISLHAVAEKDRAALLVEIDVALELLEYIGKRNGRVTVKREQNKVIPFQVSAGLSPQDDRYLITLQADALMVDPEDMLKNQTGKHLAERYKQFWSEMSGGSLEMENNFFAEQKMLGGYLKKIRFRKEGNDYYPFYLTAAGSVFVLRTAGDRAIEVIHSWLEAGLPVPGWATERYGLTGVPLWKGCPFVPENGFGEISVNLNWHFERRADKGGI